MFISPAVVGDALIVGSCAGSLYALERSTGSPVWRYDTAADGAAAEFHGEPVVIGTRLIIPTDTDSRGHLYSFDIASGERLWKVPFDTGVATAPLRAGDDVVVVSAEGEVAAIEPNKGTIKWRVAPAGKLKAMPYLPSPALSAHRMVFADNTNQLVALDARSGAMLWRKTMAARATTALVATRDAVIVGTLDGQLSWFDVRSGDLRRKVKLPAPPYGSPVLADGVLFLLAGSPGSRLIAVDAGSGELRWQHATTKEWTTFRPLLAGANVIAGNSDKELCAFDRASGECRWCLSVAQTPRGLSLSNDGVLYVGSLSGVVQAYRIGPLQQKSVGSNRP